MNFIAIVTQFHHDGTPVIVRTLKNVPWLGIGSLTDRELKAVVDSALRDQFDNGGGKIEIVLQEAKPS